MLVVKLRLQEIMGDKKETAEVTDEGGFWRKARFTVSFFER